jgi:type IV secretion system protein VirB10
MSGGREPGIGGGMNDVGSLVEEERRLQLTTLQKVGIAGLLLVIVLSLIWIGRLDHVQKAAPQPDLAAAAGQTFRPAPPPPSPPTPATTVTLPLPSATTNTFFMPQQHQATPAESPIFAFSGVGDVAPAAANAAPSSPPPGSASDAILGGQAAPSSALATRLHPTMLAATKAELLPHPDLMLTEGTIIPCTLQTAIDSQLAGFVKCVLPQDIRSTTGNVVLLDRGTTVVGEIQQGLVQGQNRIFVLWDRAETPDHAVIDLSSPGTDELGRSGLPGAVNNHWWQRFGNAILLSVIQGSLQAGTALAANSGQSSGTFFNSFESNGTSISNTALQAEINIPPTLEKNQGDNVAIFVAKDLDFSDVYKLQVNGSGYGQ